MVDDKTFQISKEDLENLAKGLVSDAVKELGLDKIDVKHHIVPDGTEDKQVQMTPAEKSGNFVKALKEKNLEQIKTLAPQNETTSADGGYLVPDVTRAEILRLIEQFGQARQYMRVIPMGKAKVMNIPKKLTGVTVTRSSENTAIPDTKATLTQITLTASKVGAITALSNEVFDDNIVDLGSYVQTLIGEAFAEEEDGQYFAGTGSPFTGVFNSANTFGYSAEFSDLAAITYDMLVDMRYGVKNHYLNGGAWYLNRTVMAVLRKIKDEEGNPILFAASGNTPATMLDFPIRLVEKAPTASGVISGQPLIVLGNLNNSIIGSKQDMRMTILTEATIDGVSLAENDLTGLRVTKRDAFNPGLTEAYSIIKKA